MARCFVPREQLPIITGSDVHYLRDVLRLKSGDQLELLDGSGKIYTAKISKITNGKITCEIMAQRLSENEPAIKVTLAQALPKGRKMDLIVEKSSELGVSKIIPLLTERTVGKTAKLTRWQKIAATSAQLAGRALIPEIAALAKFEALLKIREQFDLALIPWELEKEKTLKQALRDTLLPSARILITIGPEGGFSQKEIKLAQAAGFVPVSFGKRILRTETAGLATLSMIMYELDL